MLVGPNTRQHVKKTFQYLFYFHISTTDTYVDDKLPILIGNPLFLTEVVLRMETIRR